jgi:hypothetical protein
MLQAEASADALAAHRAAEKPLQSIVPLGGYAEDTPLLHAFGKADNYRSAKLLHLLRNGVFMVMAGLIVIHMGFHFLQQLELNAHDSGALRLPVEKPADRLEGALGTRMDKLAEYISAIGADEKEPKHREVAGNNRLARTGRKSAKSDVNATWRLHASEKPLIRDDAQFAYTFELKDKGRDYARCQGTYVMAEGIDNNINGKPLYINKERDRFLAFTGVCWEITAMGYLPAVRRHHGKHGFWPGSFGGFHTGAYGRDRPDQGAWEDYSVAPRRPGHGTAAGSVILGPANVAMKTSAAVSDLEDSQWAFRFILKPSSPDYGSCAGVYLLAAGDMPEVNGRPYYVKEDRQRELVWSGLGWKIVSATSRDNIFHFAGGARPDLAEWLSYEVRREKIESDLDQATGYRFETKAGARNTGSCDGEYWPVGGNELNGKHYFVNRAKQRFLAWNNAASIWEVVDMKQLPKVKMHHRQHGFWPGSFSGIHAGGGQRPDDNSWADYVVSAINTRHLLSAKEYVFRPKPGGNNYAACDGEYRIAEGEDFELNGRPYYLCKEKGRFLAWSGTVWEITATQYLAGIKKHHKKHGHWPGTFGGFHSGGGEWPDDGHWANYDVKAKGPKITLPDDEKNSDIA